MYPTRILEVTLSSGSKIIALVFGITQKDGGPTRLDDPTGIVTCCGSYPTTRTRIPARWRDRATARVTASLKVPGTGNTVNGSFAVASTLLIGNLFPFDLRLGLNLSRRFTLTLGRQLSPLHIRNSAKSPDHFANADPHVYDSLSP